MVPCTFTSLEQQHQQAIDQSISIDNGLTNK
ncbi:MAG: hypothetical protein ACI90V_007941 [Bacillariaceae sp.]|jgi:hypothetical protein